MSGGKKKKEKGEKEEKEATYVIKHTARVLKKSAVPATSPAMAAPNLPRQAKKPTKKAMTSKKRPMMKNTHPNRHMYQ